MPTVIADSSAFIHLGAIGRMPLLRELFGQILVPPAVWQEVVEAGQGRAGEAELRQAVQEGWVSIETPPPSAVLPAGSPPLHPGEIEAIRLALSKPGSLLVVDELIGRAVATGLGLEVIGIVGLLVLARQRNLIANLEAELHRLRGPGRFRISHQLFQHALRLAGESN
jgi:hypothetical protein